MPDASVLATGHSLQDTGLRNYVTLCYHLVVWFNYIRYYLCLFVSIIFIYFHPIPFTFTHFSLICLSDSYKSHYENRNLSIKKNRYSCILSAVVYGRYQKRAGRGKKPYLPEKLNSGESKSTGSWLDNILVQKL